MHHFILVQHCFVDTSVEQKLTKVETKSELTRDVVAMSRYCAEYSCGIGSWYMGANDEEDYSRDFAIDANLVV